MSQNAYAFCGNNPVNFIDPSGHVYTAADKKNGVNKAAVDKATKDYNAAKATGDKAGMTAAHNAAEAARSAAANKSTSSSGSSGGSSASVPVTVYRNGTAIAAQMVNGKTTANGGLRVNDIVLISAQRGTLYRVNFVDGNGLASSSTKAELSKIDVTFGSFANSSVLSQTSMNVVKSALYIAGFNSATITSTIRTKAGQVNAMYDNCVRDIKQQVGIYKNDVGKDVVNAFINTYNPNKPNEAETKQAMLNAIPAGDGPFPNLSLHMVPLSNYKKLNVLDLGYNGLGGYSNAMKSWIL